jgi:hypothetical protein
MYSNHQSCEELTRYFPKFAWADFPANRKHQSISERWLKTTVLQVQVLE